MSPICENCGGRAEELANPYYGTALAVHDHVVACSLCGHVTFESAAVPPPPDAPAAGFWQRVRSWFAR